MNNQCFVGVNLDTEQVVSIARYEDTARDCYILPAEHGPKCDGTIVLDTDDQTFNGRRALAIALHENQQDIGLGWRFTIKGGPQEWGV